MHCDLLIVTCCKKTEGERGNYCPWCLDQTFVLLPSPGKGKGKGKRGFVWRLVVNAPVRRSDMVRVLKGSHSFTCTPRVHPLSE